MGAAVEYLRDAGRQASLGWQQFWFSAVEPVALGRLRIVAGLASFIYLATFSLDLVRWFGPSGILDRETVRALSGWPGGLSELPTAFDSAFWLIGFHVVALLLAAATTVGLFARWSTPLTLCVVLTYIHRAPLLTGLFEPVLTMMLLYVSLGPSGRSGSWFRGAEQAAPSIAANVAVRLCQVHVAAIYALMGLSQLASETWWGGEAVWWLIAHPESRLLDLTGLHRAPYLVELWTHGIVLFELLFVVLIWNRWWRPLLLAISIPFWISLAIITGQVLFCGLMLAAGVAYRVGYGAAPSEIPPQNEQ